MHPDLLNKYAMGGYATMAAANYKIKDVEIKLKEKSSVSVDNGTLKTNSVNEVKIKLERANVYNGIRHIKPNSIECYSPGDITILVNEKELIMDVPANMEYEIKKRSNSQLYDLIDSIILELKNREKVVTEVKNELTTASSIDTKSFSKLNW